jgi:hypothetical protein
MALCEQFEPQTWAKHNRKKNNKVKNSGRSTGVFVVEAEREGFEPPDL